MPRRHANISMKAVQNKGRSWKIILLELNMQSDKCWDRRETRIKVGSRGAKGTLLK